MIETVRELWGWTRQHAWMLFLATVAAYSQLHYDLYGPPAHLIILPALSRPPTELGMTLLIAAGKAAVMLLIVQKIKHRRQWKAQLRTQVAVSEAKPNTLRPGTA